MVPQIHYVFGKNITSAGVLEDNVFHNTISDVMCIEISGDFSGEITIEGRVNKEVESFTPIAGINMTEFKVAKTITSAGIYEYGVEGIQDIRVNVKSISGSATILGRFVNCAA